MYTNTLYETELTKLEDDDNAPSVVSISYGDCYSEEDDEQVSLSIEICNTVRDLTLYLPCTSRRSAKSTVTEHW
jgi:hypothetical protein